MGHVFFFSSSPACCWLISLISLLGGWQLIFFLPFVLDFLAILAIQVYISKTIQVYISKMNGSYFLGKKKRLPSCLQEELVLWGPKIFVIFVSARSMLCPPPFVWWRPCSKRPAEATSGGFSLGGEVLEVKGMKGDMPVCNCGSWFFWGFLIKPYSTHTHHMLLENLISALNKNEEMFCFKIFNEPDLLLLPFLWSQDSPMTLPSETEQDELCCRMTLGAILHHIIGSGFFERPILGSVGFIYALVFSCLLHVRVDEAEAWLRSTFTLNSKNQPSQPLRVPFST